MTEGEDGSGASGEDEDSRGRRRGKVDAVASRAINGKRGGMVGW